MKKIIFSFILLFGATLFMPQSSFAQVVVKSKHNSTKKVVLKKPNRHQGVTVKGRSTHHRPSRVVVAKPNSNPISHRRSAPSLLFACTITLVSDDENPIDAWSN